MISTVVLQSAIERDVTEERMSVQALRIVEHAQRRRRVPARVDQAQAVQGGRLAEAMPQQSVPFAFEPEINRHVKAVLGAAHQFVREQGAKASRRQRFNVSPLIMCS